MDRIKESIKQVMGLELIWSTVSVLIAYVAGGWLIRALIGTNDPVVMENAVLNLRVCTLFFFPLGALFVLRNAIQPMGFKIAPVISSAIELIVKVLFCFLLIPRMGYLGVVITEPIIWVICAAYLGVVYFGTQRKGCGYLGGIQNNRGYC